LYVLGLAALGLALHQPGRTPSWLGWHADLALALYVSVAAWVCWALPREDEWSWFLPAQAAVAAVVLALAVGVSLSFATLGERLAGPLAVLLLVPGAVLLAGVAPGACAAGLRRAALALGALTVALLAWAWPEPRGAAWLQRSAWLLLALVAGLF